MSDLLDLLNPSSDSTPNPGPTPLPGTGSSILNSLGSSSSVNPNNSPTQGGLGDLLNPTPAPPPVQGPPQPAAPVPITLAGGGWHQWLAQKLGDDIVAHGLGTVFGGGNDPEDNSVGINGNPITKTTEGFSIPTGRIASTMGSPFPQLPPGTMIVATNKRTGQTATGPIIDEGPTYNDDADTGKPGSAMIDIAPGTAAKLGMGNDSTDPISIKIVGGAQHLTPSQFYTPAPDLTDASPADYPLLQTIGQALQNPKVIGKGGQGPYDVDQIQKLLPQFQSGALQPYIRKLDGHLDLAQNSETSNPALSQREYQAALGTFGMMVHAWGAATRALQAERVSAQNMSAARQNQANSNPGNTNP